MASLSLVRDGLAARLRTIPSLANRTFEVEPPGDVEPPVAFVGMPRKPGNGKRAMEYHSPANGLTTVYLPVVVLVYGADKQAAQDALDAYLATTGSESVIYAIEGDPTLGGAAQSAEVLGLDDYDAFGSALGAEWIVEVVF